MGHRAGAVLAFRSRNFAAEEAVRLYRKSDRCRAAVLLELANPR